MDPERTTTHEDISLLRPPARDSIAATRNAIPAFRFFSWSTGLCGIPAKDLACASAIDSCKNRRLTLFRKIECSLAILTRRWHHLTDRRRKSHAIFIHVVSQSTQRKLVGFIGAVMTDIVDKGIAKIKRDSAKPQVRQIECFAKMPSLKTLRFQHQTKEEHHGIVELVDRGIDIDVSVVERRNVGTYRLLEIHQSRIVLLAIEMNGADLVQRRRDVGMFFTERLPVLGQCFFEVGEGEFRCSPSLRTSARGFDIRRRG